MGNRAVITTESNYHNNGVGVYLHWNGGRDSVEAFLTYCNMKNYRPPEVDCYGWARLCQVIGNFFGGFCSVGIDTINYLDCDNYDNGVYIIEDWQIVDRKELDNTPIPACGEQKEYDLYEMLKEINRKQPTEEQIEIVEPPKKEEPKEVHDFLDDDEKMNDFIRMSKKEFLDSYSYLTEEEYNLTADLFEGFCTIYNI